MGLSEADLAALDATEEVEIETRAADGTVHRTIVWVVVEDGTAYLRSVNGATARWYREAIARPDVALRVGGRRIAVRAVPAVDEASVEACSAGLARKYRADYSLGSMLRADVLDTTLRLDPA
jgi:hypothetical protein